MVTFAEIAARRPDCLVLNVSTIPFGGIVYSSQPYRIAFIQHSVMPFRKDLIGYAYSRDDLASIT